MITPKRLDKIMEDDALRTRDLFISDGKGWVPFVSDIPSLVAEVRRLRAVLVEIVEMHGGEWSKISDLAAEALGEHQL